jgi:hypothetical protein
MGYCSSGGYMPIRCVSQIPPYFLYSALNCTRAYRGHYMWNRVPFGVCVWGEKGLSQLECFLLANKGHLKGPGTLGINCFMWEALILTWHLFVFLSFFLFPSLSSSHFLFISLSLPLSLPPECSVLQAVHRELPQGCRRNQRKVQVS